MNPMESELYEKLGHERVSEVVEEGVSKNY